MVAVRLDAEREGRDLAQKLRVTGFPTILYLDADGNEWGRLPGFLPAGPFLEQGQSFLKDAREQPLLEAKLKQNPSNSALASDLAQRFARQGNLKKALAMASLVLKGPQNAAAAQAYVALGRAYLDSGSPEAAKAWFSRVGQASKDASTKAYGYFGLALCALATRNNKAAHTELNRLLAMPDCPPGIQEKARELLQQLPP